MLLAFPQARPRYGFFLLTKLTLVSAALLTNSGCGFKTKESASQPKIIGGRVADEHAFMAGIAFGASDETGCGGTFVTDHIVVTAAHCLQGLDSMPSVIPGGNHPKQAQRLKVLTAYAHEAFDMEHMQNDIAILITESPAADSIVPLAFNTDPAWPTDATAVTVIGRGNETTIGEIFDGGLRQVDLTIVPTPTCQKIATEGMTITSGQICAGDLEAGGYDSCQGDSGGPLVTFDHGVAKLVGVVSWGIGCAQAHNPGIYTRVSTQAAWIAEQIQKISAAEQTPRTGLNSTPQKRLATRLQRAAHQSRQPKERCNAYIAASVVWGKPEGSSLPGQLTLRNHTEIDLFTWKLSCPFPFTLADQHGHTYRSRADAALVNTVKVEYPTEPAAAVARGKSITLLLTAQGPMSKTPDCTFNQLWLPLVAASGMQRPTL